MNIGTWIAARMLETRLATVLRCLTWTWLLLCQGATASALPETSVDPVAENRECALAPDDEQWLRSVLDGWSAVLGRYLKAGDTPRPAIITYDARCSYTLGDQARWAGAPHGGRVRLPHGATLPVVPNAVNIHADRTNVVVMSLPSIWQSVGYRSEIGLTSFLEGVLLHELTHAYQTSVSPTLSFFVLQKQRVLPAGVSDDSVQEAFQANIAYVRDYQEERDVLFRAASASSDRAAGRLACEGLARLRARRARYFVGEWTAWSALDEVSLTTEGLGQWIAYRWLTGERALEPALVPAKLRSRYWSQDEGLALFLVIDRLVPDWQRRLLTAQPQTAEALLSAACSRGR